MLTNVVDTTDSSPLSAFLTKLKTQPTANGPFAIVANYLGQGSKAPLIHYEPSTFIQESTREMAKKIVIHSLKTGSAHYNDLIDLLLEDKHPRVDLKREEAKAFGEKELTYVNRILPLASERFIVAATYNTVNDVLEKLAKKNPQDIQEYYDTVLKEVEKKKASLPTFYNNLIGKNLDHNKHAEDPSLSKEEKKALRGFNREIDDIKYFVQTRSFTTLKFYLPKAITLDQSYFHIDGIDALPEVIDKMKQDRDNLRKTYEIIDTKYQDKFREIDDFAKDYNDKRRARLIETLWQDKGLEEKAGIPWAYKYFFTSKEELQKSAGLVPFNTVDPDTGSNLALLALQYGNETLYWDLFEPAKEITWESTRVNNRQLSASIYEQGLDRNNPKNQEEALELIEKKDSEGELLRQLEKLIFQYQQQWYKNNLKFKELNESKNVFVKIYNLFRHYLFDPLEEDVFKAREQELINYAELAESALRAKIPINFFDDLTKLFGQRRKGRLERLTQGLITSSQLHGHIKKTLTQIEAGKKDKYHILVNASDELNQELKIANDRFSRQDERYEKKFKEQEQTHQKAIASQSQEMKEQEGRYKQELKEQEAKFEQKMATMMQMIEAMQQGRPMLQSNTVTPPPTELINESLAAVAQKHEPLPPVGASEEINTPSSSASPPTHLRGYSPRFSYGNPAEPKEPETHGESIKGKERIYAAGHKG